MLECYDLEEKTVDRINRLQREQLSKTKAELYYFEKIVISKLLGKMHKLLIEESKDA